MKKSYADICLDRANAAIKGPWVIDTFCPIVKYDVPELARRLKESIESLRFAAKTFKEIKVMEKLSNMLIDQADELERMPGEEKK
jgi:hypothetical protein